MPGAKREAHAGRATYGIRPLLPTSSKIREMEKLTGKHQPVVALTAHAMKCDHDLCLAAGMDGYLTRPIRQQELDELLDQYTSAVIATPVVPIPTET